MAPRVAFQGERGAYGEMATLQYFPDVKLLPLKSFQDVFDAAETGKVEYIVVPLENSIEGSINEIYDLLLQTKMNVVGEIYQRVRHCLIANRGTKMIRYVHSHPQALAQCRAYLQNKGLKPMPTYDTAGAAKMIKENKMVDSAAIASKRAAELYDMEILDEGIEDRKNNYTRFFVLSPKKKKSGKSDPHDIGGYNHKTSIIFSVRHVPGALFGILGEFAIRKINLTKIESRPTKETPWEYNFYVDFEGHLQNKAVHEALLSIKPKTSYIKILGSYKKAEFH
ncbi:MAG TPA: prephenate dehydratase [Nitrososphaera sp.]|jgi:prephenate dehydratase|nr:prephenate dehydratase [Nitrososphaera sp.]